MKFITLINVKMPTIVGILTFICRINTASESSKQEKSVFFNIYEQLKLIELSMKKFCFTWWPGKLISVFVPVLFKGKKIFYDMTSHLGVI